VLVGELERVVLDLDLVGHGPLVVRGNVNRVLEAPCDAYHAHVRALAAHSNQKKSFKNTHTSDEFLEKPVASCVVSFPLGSKTKI
jgi:hypothetical protein